MALKVVLIVAAVVTSILLAVLFFGTQITAYYFAQDALRNEPAVELVPTLLNDFSVADGPGTTISLYGHTLEAPWGEIAKTDARELLTRLEFDSGQVLIFFDPAHAKGQKDIMQEGTGMTHEDVVALFGESAGTNYGLTQIVLQFQPSKVSLFSSKQHAVRNNMLTLMKRLKALEAGTGVFAVELDGFRGVQKGNPAHSRRVFLELFDEQDRLFSVWLYSPDSAPPLTQAEVNRVMRTLK